MSDFYREQHKLRLAYMPWLYPRLKPRHRDWAAPWQAELQRQWSIPVSYTHLTLPTIYSV